uniref:Integrin, alpha V n=1 Tax=Gasterosteus aculeatus aculeatus TaxID=481459 RepID=A0AAQ4S8N1_GASAC
MSGTRAALGALALMCLLVRRGGTFNLDARTPSVFSGPTGSYFGFSVDFFSPPNGKQADVLVGAPRANTTPSSSVEERGAVYSCPWKTSTCQQLQFDITDDRKNTEGAQMEFKSKQWFGASVRSDGEHILACAPLYQWSTFGVSEREPVGTCYLKKESTVVEYSPCRSKANSPEGQGFCQAGFSVDFLKKNNRVVVGGPGSFYWQGQLISDDLSEIFSRFDSLYITQYENTLATKSAIAQYDDSYLGYSVTVGDFNDDGKEDYVTGVPRGHNALGYVNIFNGLNMGSMVNFTGAQMAAYFGHSVAASDVNNDDWVDLLVGAPLFMDRGSDGKLREVGQVSVYLSRGGFSFHPPQLLTGSEVYARYGSAIAALGDLDMDGYNDVAISAPYGGPDHHGVVYIHNGRPRGPDSSPSQVLQGRWASSYMPASFGYSMTGNTDIDQNGYPDLIVGVFGADKAVLYRARPVISVNATLDMTPQIINPEEKTCTLPGTSTLVSCFTVKYCLKASGRGAPATLNFRVDLLLDRLKQKDATKRVLFLHSRTLQFSKNMTVSNGKAPTCEEQEVFLRDDREFRDKITPISVAMEYSLDHQRAADQTGLQPILDMSAPSNVTKQAHILLDCGEDNICKPDLRLSVTSDREQIFIGDDNALTLEVSAENLGEGAYEAELHVFPPQQADFTGVVRSQSLSRLSCAYKKENQTKMVVCDLGNPMKGGTKVLAELQFSVHQLSEEDTSVKFDVQMVSSNQFDNTSPRVSTVTKLAVLAKVSIRGSEHAVDISYCRPRLLLPSTSPTAVHVSYCRLHLLLPPSTSPTAVHISYRRPHLLLLPSTSPTAVHVSSYCRTRLLLPSTSPPTAIHISSYCRTHLLLLPYTSPPTAVHISSYCRPHLLLLPSTSPPTAVHISSYCRTHLLLLPYTSPPTAVHISSYCRPHLLLLPSTSPPTAVHISSYCRTHLLLLPYTSPPTAVHISSYCRTHLLLLPSTSPPTAVHVSSYCRPRLLLLPSTSPPAAVHVSSCCRPHLLLLPYTSPPAAVHVSSCCRTRLLLLPYTSPPAA